MREKSKDLGMRRNKGKGQSGRQSVRRTERRLECGVPQVNATLSHKCPLAPGFLA